MIVSAQEKEKKEGGKKNMLLGSFASMHEWELKIASLRGAADRHTSAISLDASLQFVAERFYIKMEMFGHI